VRQTRAGETWFKKITAKAFYRLIHRITSVKIPLDTGDFRLMDYRVVEALTTMRERNRFLRGMVPWVGFKQIGVYYNRDPRFAGESKFGTLRPMLKFALNAITSFSYVPLQLATYLGFLIAGLALISIMLVIFMRLFTPAEALMGQATTLVAVLFLGGVQLISLGIIGEYLGRIYDEVKGRPLYLVAQTWGFDKEHPEAQAGRVS
jgi:polyisoprenyl-phosphate glycosyltransferase